MPHSLSRPNGHSLSLRQPQPLLLLIRCSAVWLAQWPHRCALPFENARSPKCLLTVPARFAMMPTPQLVQCAPEMAEQEFTTGQFDAFYYPSDRDGPEDIIERPPPIESAEYDDACPCPSHCDPGIFTLVAETESALEARATADPESSLGSSWQRLDLKGNELCIVTGQQLAKMTAGRIAASPHRVALTQASRASFVFEVHLAGSLDPEEAEEETDVEQPDVSDGVYAADASSQSDGGSVRVHRRGAHGRSTSLSRRLGMVRLPSWSSLKVLGQSTAHRQRREQQQQRPEGTDTALR